MLVRLAVFAAALSLYINDRDLLSFGDGVAFFEDRPYLLALCLALMGRLAFHLFSNARRHELFFEYTCDELSCSKCAAPLCRIKRAFSPRDFCAVAARKLGEAVPKSHKSGRVPAHKHS